MLELTIDLLRFLAIMAISQPKEAEAGTIPYSYRMTPVILGYDIMI